MLQRWAAGWLPTHPVLVPVALTPHCLGVMPLFKCLQLMECVLLDILVLSCCSMLQALVKLCTQTLSFGGAVAHMHGRLQHKGHLLASLPFTAAAAAAAVQVQVLRNYLGTSLIHAYELRHLTLRRLLVSSSAGAAGSSSGMLDLDAELYLQAYCRSVMLEWVDALWSCFLEVRGLNSNGCVGKVVTSMVIEQLASATTSKGLLRPADGSVCCW